MRLPRLSPSSQSLPAARGGLVAGSSGAVPHQGCKARLIGVIATDGGPLAQSKFKIEILLTHRQTFWLLIPKYRRFDFDRKGRPIIDDEYMQLNYG